MDGTRVLWSWRCGYFQRLAPKEKRGILDAGYWGNGALDHRWDGNFRVGTGMSIGTELGNGAATVRSRSLSGST